MGVFSYHSDKRVTNLQNRCFWYMVDSKLKGYFWGLCMVNMGLKIQTFDQYLDFGRKDLPENASKRLCEKLIFCDFAHFYLIFPLHFTLKICYFEQNRNFPNFWLCHSIWWWNVFPWESFNTLLCFSIFLGCHTLAWYPASTPQKALNAAINGSFLLPFWKTSKIGVSDIWWTQNLKGIFEGCV